MDILQLFDDFNIPYYTEGYKYCREGWVNVDCPFCIGNPGPHLGFEIATSHFNCWRCGHHWTEETLSKLLNLPFSAVKDVMKSYGQYVSIEKKRSLKFEPFPFKLPSNLQPLQKAHRQYLERRKFDPDKLEKLWSLQASGPISTLKTNGKTLHYSHRIIIPFTWDNKIVSFDSRDITGKAMNKYQACPKERETIPHKAIVYGLQQYWTDRIVVVEGPTDAWRFGVNSVAVSGIKFTLAQVRVLAKTFKTVHVCFDGGEIQARKQADELVASLRARNVDARRVDITGDPGGMDQKEADYFVKQFIK